MYSARKRGMRGRNTGERTQTPHDCTARHRQLTHTRFAQRRRVDNAADGDNRAAHTPHYTRKERVAAAAASWQHAEHRNAGPQRRATRRDGDATRHAPADDQRVVRADDLLQLRAWDGLVACEVHRVAAGTQDVRAHRVDGVAAQDARQRRPATVQSPQPRQCSACAQSHGDVLS